MSFTLALACLGTNTPWINAIFSMLIVMLIRTQGKHYFPSRIKSLRNAAKDDPKANILLKGLESEFLSLKVLIKGYPIFIIGYLFLCFVIFSPFIAKIIPTINTYIGI